MVINGYRTLHKFLKLFFICFAIFSLLNLFSRLVRAEVSNDNHLLEQEIRFSTEYENNRTLGEHFMWQGIYQLLMDDHFRVETGFSYNDTYHLINALFIEVGYESIYESPYSLRFKFLGNQYGEYGKAANSIIPYLSWYNEKYFIDIGLNYRFLNTNPDQLWNIFYYQTEIYEIIPYYKLGRKYSFNNDKFLLILEVKNFNEMYAGNMGAYSFFIRNQFKVNDKFVVFGNIGLWQSGSIGFSAVYYKTTINGGIEVKL